MTSNLSTDLLPRSLLHVGVYRTAMKKLLGRLNDWRHERHISRLGLQCRAAMSAGHRDMARLLWNAQAAAIKARSPAQVARMERHAFARLAPQDQRTFLKHGGSPGSR